MDGPASFSRGMRTGHPKHRQRPVAEHADPLVREFFALLAEEKLALADCAQRAGLSHVTISKWKSRHAPLVTTLQAALNVLGYELVIRPKLTVA